MNALVDEFESDTGHTVQLAFGSSGRFFAQISNGAPFQLFFSADQAKPQALLDAGLAVAESRVTYAVGALVLWSADESLTLDGPDALSNPDVTRIAIANPRLAPYGLAASQVLESLALNEALSGKLVQGENIAQAHQFVSTGNARVGFVAASQVLQGGRLISGSGWPVPAQLHEPIRQDAVLLRPGESSVVARQLLDFVRSERGRVVIASFGYAME